MTDSMQKLQHPCWAEFSCFYKVGDTCRFRQEIEAILSVFQDIHHEGSNCIVSQIDMFREPCLELDDEGRKRGIGNPCC